MEEKIIIFLQSRSSKFLDLFFQGVSYLASWIGAIFLFIVILLFVNKKFGLTFGLGMLCSIGLNYILKTLIARPRPYVANQNIIDKLTTIGYSFPSGHMVSVTFMVLAILLLIKYLPKTKKYKYLSKKWVKIVFYLIAVLFIILTAISRMYLGQHFLSDIIGGVLIAILCFKITLLIYKKIEKNKA